MSNHGSSSISSYLNVGGEKRNNSNNGNNRDQQTMAAAAMAANYCLGGGTTTTTAGSANSSGGHGINGTNANPFATIYNNQSPNGQFHGIYPKPKSTKRI
jgi:hypothetical protein